MERGGQIAIFVIIAVLIVGAFAWLVVYPRLPARLGGAEVSPSAYLRDCLQGEFAPLVSRLSAQGGYYEPTHALAYQDEKIQYLCYTDEEYKPCVIQQPLLAQHVTGELSAQLEPKAQACMDSLVAQYERRGYTVERTAASINVSIIPHSINVDYGSSLTISKESTQTFPSLEVKYSSELYDLLLTATSILQSESTLGDSETTYYMQFYPNLKIEKLKQDKDTIYTLTNVVTEDRFRFATRSLIWPQGY